MRSSFQLFAAQFGFELLRCRQTAFEFGRQRFEYTKLAHAQRRAQAAQGVFDLKVIFALAQNQADAGRILFAFQQIVHNRQIKVHLARVLGFELFALQVDHDVAMQFHMIKQQVEIKIVLVGRAAADLQMVLRTQKRKALPQLHQKIAQMFEQPALQIAFARIVGQCQKVEAAKPEELQRVLRVAVKNVAWNLSGAHKIAFYLPVPEREKKENTK